MMSQHHQLKPNDSKYVFAVDHGLINEKPLLLVTDTTPLRLCDCIYLTKALPHQPFKYKTSIGS
jgi:hypothetical protein